MTTHDFIGRLREAPAKQLVFTNSDGATIHGGYHLTELKAASFDTVDCGAEKNQWNETIVQLWVPEDEEDGEFMTAQKFWQSTKGRAADPAPSDSRNSFRVRRRELSAFQLPRRKRH